MKSKYNKYEIEISAELDLHGYTSEEAKSAVQEFINEAQQQNITHIRIIVGKGLRSENGSVLGPVVKNYLDEHNFKHSPAKLQNGGDGALVVSI